MTDGEYSVSDLVGELGGKKWCSDPECANDAFRVLKLFGPRTVFMCDDGYGCTRNYLRDCSCIGGGSIYCDHTPMSSQCHN